MEQPEIVRLGDGSHEAGDVVQDALLLLLLLQACNFGHKWEKNRLHFPNVAEGKKIIFAYLGIAFAASGRR